MFRQLTAFLLLSAFMVQTFSGVAVIIDYYTNTGVYAKNCVNKARPKMHCNGKCQMMKKLREEEKKEQQSAENKAELKFQLLSSKSFYPEMSYYSFIVKSHFGNYLSSDPIDRATDFFHPPGA